MDPRCSSRICQTRTRQRLPTDCCPQRVTLCWPRADFRKRFFESCGGVRNGERFAKVAILQYSASTGNGGQGPFLLYRSKVCPGPNAVRITLLAQCLAATVTDRNITNTIAIPWYDIKSWRKTPTSSTSWRSKSCLDLARGAGAWTIITMFCSVIYPAHSTEHRTHEATQANRDDSQSTTLTLSVL